MSHHDEATQAFFALSKHLQERIDDAFHATVTANKDSEPPLKKQKLNEDAGGGFILDDPDVDIDSGGGFLIDHVDEPTRLPLSSIPNALLLLDLPPDDEQVLGIFRNAASGWDSAGHTITTTANDDDALTITKDDWRAVCAVLLDPFATGVEGDGESQASDPRVDSDVHMLSDDGADYVDPDESDSDYYEPPEPSVRRTRTRLSAKGKRRARGDDDDVDEDASDFPTKLSPSQKSACLDAFALFFVNTDPSTTSESQSHPADIRKRRIMIADIQRVAKLLKEKITAEDMLEMLDVFSTSPDKSMGLEDFERMMVAAKLV